jgi:hypothetical protein
MDPAGPLFAEKDCRIRLCKGDAKFVESIQNNGIYVFGLGTFHEDRKFCPFARWLRQGREVRW